MKARAVQIDRTGGPEVLQVVDVDIPAPGPGEVRIAHKACGVNFIDTYHRSGLYPLVLPATLGTEGAGTVQAVGAGVDHVKVGDRVAYAARAPGSYATARVVSAIPVVRLPDAIDFPTAAAMMLKGLTVQYLLRRTRHALKSGDYLVWHAAAGGVGLIACQWAKSLGLKLIGTAGSAEKCKLALEHGATHVIDYTTEDIVARVKEITGGRGVDVVFDSVGKDTWARSLSCLAPLGLMVSFGNASGPVGPVDLLQLSQKGSLYVTRPTLFTHLATREAAQEMANELFDMVLSKRIAIDPPRTYKLEDAAQAHRDLEGRVTTGSSVLLCD